MPTHTVKIYYYRNANTLPGNVLMDITFHARVTKELMEKYHVLMYEYRDTVENENDINEYLKSICSKFSDDYRNPLSVFVSESNQQRVRESETHTSIAIGDIIEVDHICYVVRNIGFEKIK